MAYDPAGRLYQTSGSTTTRFLYDGHQAIAEYNASGGLLRRHIPGLGLDLPVATFEGAGTADRRWLYADERGSVVALAGGTGSLLARNTYDEYGVPGPANAGRFQYTGQAWLPEAQLYHYRARAYAPNLGRFMQTDPIGYGDGPNLYVYVGGDPVNFTDPMGLCDDPTDRTCVPHEVARIDVTASLCGRNASCIYGSDAIRDFLDRAFQMPDIVVRGSRGASEVIQTLRNDLSVYLTANCPMAQLDFPIAGGVIEGKIGARGAASANVSGDLTSIRSRTTFDLSNGVRWRAVATQGVGYSGQFGGLYTNRMYGRDILLARPGAPRPDRPDFGLRQDDFVGLDTGAAVVLGYSFKVGVKPGETC